MKSWLKLKVLPTLLFTGRGKNSQQILRLEIDNSQKKTQAALSIKSPTIESKHSLGFLEPGPNMRNIEIPAVQRPQQFTFLLEAGNAKVKIARVIKPQRHWQVFLVHHSHTDIGYTDFQQNIVRDHARFLDMATNISGMERHSGFKWTCEVGWSVDNFLKQRSTKAAQKFFEAVRKDKIEVTGIYFNLAELSTPEELIRQLYFAKGVEEQNKIAVSTAMNGDVNGMSWLMPQILSKSGIKYFAMATNFVRGGAPLQRPCAFYWQAPDGSRILVWNGDHYHEGNRCGLATSLEATEENLPKHLEFLKQQDYRQDFTLLQVSGAYSDNSPPNPQIAQIVKAWNKKYTFPKIKMVALKEFFYHVEQNHNGKIPRYRLAWPDSWADGHASAAYESGLSRRVAKQLSIIETLATINQSLLPRFKYPQQEIAETRNKLMFFNEHTWGAAGSVGEPHSFKTKSQWAVKSSNIYEAAIVAENLMNNNWPAFNRIFSGNTGDVMVFNPCAWKRSDIAIVKIPKKHLDEKQGYHITDTTTSQPVPFQLLEPDPWYDRKNERVAVLASDVPSLGYKRFQVAPGKPEEEVQKQPLPQQIDGTFFKISMCEKTGGVKSIYDKELRKELVDSKSPYRLNQYIYELVHDKRGREAVFSPEPPPAGLKIRGANFKRFSPTRCRISQKLSGSLMDSLVVKTNAKGCREITQEIVLYKHLKKIDIINTIDKDLVFKPESVYFAYPFAVKKPVFRLETNGGVMIPEKQQLPGTCRDWYSLWNWLDLSNEQWGVTWATLEAPLVQLGGIQTGQWNEHLDINNGAFFSFVMNNHWYTNFRAAQEGETTFCYSLTSHKGTCNIAQATRFGGETGSPLLTQFIENGRRAATPLSEGSFCKIDKPNVTVLALKQAEDNLGFILRLWEVKGRKTTAKITFPFFKNINVSATDIVERGRDKLTSLKNSLTVEIGKHEVLTLRVLPQK